MTHNKEPSTTVVGRCPYNSHRASGMQQVYVKLPKNVSELNAFMCGGLNRTGQLCSQCKRIPVFSYTLHCLQCMDSCSGWLLYSFLALFPTTAFFIIVIMLQICVTSAQMNAFIFACQFLTSVGSMSPSYSDVILPKHIHGLALTFTALYGIWNIDFFRFLIPPFCASNQLGPIHVIALDYIVAFYPLFLTAVTYFCIQLHTRDCRLIVCLWRPFGRCLDCFREKWDPTKSLVHAFSSFLLLSYSKILSVSLQLLVYAQLYDPAGKQAGPLMVYYDASLVYFGSTHLPFALLAIFVMCVFIVLPALVLLLYPTRAFQRCLGCCRVRWHALHAFADTFQGCYKNGTEGTKDYRYFAGLYLIFRIVLLTGRATFLGPYGCCCFFFNFRLQHSIFTIRPLAPIQEQLVQHLGLLDVCTNHFCRVFIHVYYIHYKNSFGYDHCKCPFSLPEYLCGIQGWYQGDYCPEVSVLIE